jgi:hypothetical protein
MHVNVSNCNKGGVLQKCEEVFYWNDDYISVGSGSVSSGTSC